MIITVSGYATAGKDTIADHLVKAHGFYKTFMSKPLHLAMCALDPQVRIEAEEWRRLWPDIVDFHGLGGPLWKPYTELVNEVGYDTAKTVSDCRRLLQAMGTEVGRDMFDENVWLIKVRDEVWEQTGFPSVITGVRFPNEVQEFKQLAHHLEVGFQAWWVNRPDVVPARGHAGESALADYPFDRIIENDGSLSDLSMKVDDALTMALLTE